MVTIASCKNPARGFDRLAMKLALPGLAILIGVHASLASAAQTCTARSAASVAPVVELYTSEGCNSCPPADRWLSSLTAHPEVVALAYHVDYWDRLGWKDRFASPAFTRRQAEELSRNGARFAYTPQVVIDGRDQRGSPQLALSKRPEAAVSIELMRDGDRVTAHVAATAAAAPARLAAYWAVTESRHRTDVKAGENEGVTLSHDFVVREYRPVAAWSAAVPARLSLPLTSPADAAHPRRVNLVVVDAQSGRPLQALALDC
jgi:hypothetical protein